MKKILIFTMLSLTFLYAQCSRDTQKEVVTCDNKYIGKTLMWQDNSEAWSVKLKWQEANEYCSNLSLGGYSDWRLPSLKELRSIVDFKRYEPAIRKAFKNVKSKYYWSFTSYASDSSEAWIVHLYYGYDYWDSKSYTNFVRCVRWFDF